MNDPEMRRRELLRQTKRLYDERKDIPAVHPRYGRIYHELYHKEAGQQDQTGGSFYLRLVIGILCFISFVYMDQSNAGVAEVEVPICPRGVAPVKLSTTLWPLLQPQVPSVRTHTLSPDMAVG